MLDFNEITEENKKLRTTNIKGKDYVEVNERVKAFKRLFPEGFIRTDLISNENGVCVFKAYIGDGDKILATGHAYEKEGSTFINQTSYIENCETSAVGRALGFLGIGIDTSIASAEEVETAIANQELMQLENPITDIQAQSIKQIIENHNIAKDIVVTILEKYDYKKIRDIKRIDYKKIVEEIQKSIKMEDK